MRCEHPTNHGAQTRRAETITSNGPGLFAETKKQETKKKHGAETGKDHGFE